MIPTNSLHLINYEYNKTLNKAGTNFLKKEFGPPLVTYQPHCHLFNLYLIKAQPDSIPIRQLFL